MKTQDVSSTNASGFSVRQLSLSQKILLAGHSMSLISISCIAFGNLLSMLENENKLPTQPLQPQQPSQMNNPETLYGGRRNASYFTS